MALTILNALPKKPVDLDNMLAVLAGIYESFDPGDKFKRKLAEQLAGERQEDIVKATAYLLKTRLPWMRLTLPEIVQAVHHVRDAQRHKTTLHETIKRLQAAHDKALGVRLE